MLMAEGLPEIDERFIAAIEPWRARRRCIDVTDRRLRDAREAPICSGRRCPRSVDRGVRYLKPSRNPGSSATHLGAVPPGVERLSSVARPTRQGCPGGRRRSRAGSCPRSAPPHRQVRRHGRIYSDGVNLSGRSGCAIMGVATFAVASTHRRATIRSLPGGHDHLITKRDRHLRTTCRARGLGGGWERTAFHRARSATAWGPLNRTLSQGDWVGASAGSGGRSGVSDRERRRHRESAICVLTTAASPATVVREAACSRIDAPSTSREACDARAPVGPLVSRK